VIIEVRGIIDTWRKRIYFYHAFTAFLHNVIGISASVFLAVIITVYPDKYLCGHRSCIGRRILIPEYFEGNAVFTGIGSGTLTQVGIQHFTTNNMMGLATKCQQQNKYNEWDPLHEKDKIANYFLSLTILNERRHVYRNVTEGLILKFIIYFEENQG
jgi:hypothetical protein